MTTRATIEIYCQDSSHDENRCSVEVFARVGEGNWVPLGELTRGHGRTSQRIDALTDTYLDPSAPVRPPFTVRDRYRLPCKECGRVVPVRRENLNPILERCHAAGVSELSLTGLEGRLRGQA
jgi:hypothetical protein